MSTTNIAKSSSKEETRELINKHLKIENDPNYLMEMLGKKALPELLATLDVGVGKPIAGDYVEQFTQAMTVVRRADHSLLTCITHKFPAMVTDFARELEKEYACKTASERALIDLIAGAYIQWFDLSNAMTAYRGEGVPLSQTKNTYYAMLSKEKDRAYNQYIQGLRALREMKLGTSGVHINAVNAYLAHNQQINTVQDAIKGKFVEEAHEIKPESISNDLGKNVEVSSEEKGSS